MRLEGLIKGARVLGVSPAGPVTVVDVDWVGSDIVKLVYEDAAGKIEKELIYRSAEADLDLDGDGRPWSLDAEPELFMLVSEAMRIRLAYLFDPFLAAETSDVEPYPHQIDAVYGEMLTRQPLRAEQRSQPHPGAGRGRRRRQHRRPLPLQPLHRPRGRAQRQRVRQGAQLAQLPQPGRTTQVGTAPALMDDGG
jgi:hypothetical protein